MASILRLAAILAVIMLPIIQCAPVKPSPPKDKEPSEKSSEDDDTGLEYDRYLKEVVSILETDPIFKKKLEEANISDIKSGNIADHLDLVHHGIRTKLDEIKRREVDRLKELFRRQMRVKNGQPLKMPEHLDHGNLESFETEDLKKLIIKATQDLDELDSKRREEFKSYEMEKEHEKRQKLNKLSEEEREKENKRLEEMDKKHRDHPKMKHPGSKDQLEEVWEETDDMKGNEFNPKTFFMMHDTNGDGMWDPMELEALFEREIAKAYSEGNEEDDPVEREENRQRMREHVMKEIDKNKDYMVTMEEFLDSTKKEEFEKDEGWEDVDEQDNFNEDELKQYEEKLKNIPLEKINVPPSDHLQPPQQAGAAQMKQQVPPQAPQQQGQPVQGQGQPIQQQAVQFQQGQGQINVQAAQDPNAVNQQMNAGQAAPQL